MVTGDERGCPRCAHFIDGWRELERALSGMAALSSALGSTRGDAGLCELSQRLMNPIATCPDFEPRPTPGPPPV